MELGSRVVHGTYPSGSILPRADDLATELGVSRTVVREATRVLAEKGLVEPRQRVGTRVRERREWDLVDREIIAWQGAAGPDVQFFRDLSEARMAIEGTAARLAARRASPDAVRGMRQFCEQMERQAGDPSAFMRADLRLHATILRAADNPILLQLAHTISEGLQASRDLTVRSESENLRSVPLHAAVVEAVAAGDEEEGAKRMTLLLQQALDDIEEIMHAEPGGDAGGTGATARRPQPVSAP
jgi:GntR family transcriptional regulator, galactonate operon transcriptional repressor